MYRVWNLGNTTIRNPNRIELGLRLFAKEFQGNVHGPIAESSFARRLTEEGIVDSGGSYSDLLGRKWRSAFVKLGFATNQRYRVGEMSLPVNQLAKKKPQLELDGLEYELTPAGRHLLNADTIGAIQDVFLRQLVRHELPSPVEPRFPQDGRMKPFIFLLQVLDRLNGLNEPGVDKVETGAFLQLFVDHTPKAVDQTVQRILEFRRQREIVQGNDKRKLDLAQLTEASEGRGVIPDTLLDYADTTFRYTQMTGLVTMRGSRLILRENRLPIIRALLEEEPRFLADTDPLEYIADFYAGTSLPTDNVAFALQEIQRLSTEMQKYNKDVPPEVEGLSLVSAIQEVERVRYKLLELLGWAKEEEFARDQADEASLQEIIRYLDALETQRGSRELEIIDRPTYLEWTVWRGFLAIDHIAVEIHQTRRFPLDEDLRPRHPAPGGGADMIFEFRDYILVVEVTLTSSSRQEAAEGEPVRRHVANVKETTSKDVYGIFIAPTIDNNTAETFRIGTWYRGDEVDYVNIVPLTLKQFQLMIAALLTYKYSPREMQQLMDRCLAYRNTRAPEWKRMITTETNRWIDRLN